MSNLLAIKSLKEEGNDLFKSFCFAEALDKYSEAANLAEETFAKEVSEELRTEMVNVYRNRAMCHIKIGNFGDAVNDCSKVLEYDPADVKALFRRCEALEKLNKLSEAYEDGKKLVHLQANNGAVQELMRNLTAKINSLVIERDSTPARLNSMLKIAFDESGDQEKRKQAFSNLIVLARGMEGANMMYASGLAPKLIELTRTEKNNDILASTISILDYLADKDAHRSREIFNSLTYKTFNYLLAQQPSVEVTRAAGHFVQTCLIYGGELDRFRDILERHEEKKRLHGPQGLGPLPRYTPPEEIQKWEEEIGKDMALVLDSYKATAAARDVVVEVLTKLFTRWDGFSWTKLMLDEWNIVERLLNICSRIRRQEGFLEVSEDAAMNSALLLSRIYDDLLSDNERDRFSNQCQNFFRQLFADQSIDSKVEAINCLSFLLRGPHSIGSAMLGTEGVTDLILAMVQSEDNDVMRRTALECLVHAASKTSRCAGLVTKAVPLLKQIYKSSTDDSMKVRALVGLCRLGTHGGSDASVKPLAEGSTLVLAKACCRYLASEKAASDKSGNDDPRLWAAEGLAFLTLDGDVKEEFVSNTAALQSLAELGKAGNVSAVYPVATILVNMCNAYDKKKIDDQMVELAKFAKQHIPETHAKDKEEFVEKRIRKLAGSNIVSAIHALEKVANLEQSREQFARVLLAMAEIQDLRGLIVAQGGTRSLLSLANKREGSAKCRDIAAQALAKMAITQDPEIAFPGQRALELVKPMLRLLHPENTSLQHYESLMALTNLTAHNLKARALIVAEQGVPRIENFMYDDHEDLQRAACECMCNMVQTTDLEDEEEEEPKKLTPEEKEKKEEEKRKRHPGCIWHLFRAKDNDRLRFFVLLLADEDPGVVLAASGGLAAMTIDKPIARRVVEVNNWIEKVSNCISNEDARVQHRGVCIVRNLIHAGRSIAETIVMSPMLELLTAVSLLRHVTQQIGDVIQNESRKQAAEIAQECLEAFQLLGFVKKQKPTGEMPKVPFIEIPEETEPEKKPAANTKKIADDEKLLPMPKSTPMTITEIHEISEENEN